MFKLREETKTNEVSDGEISLTCVWRWKHYNILTVKITIVRTIVRTLEEKTETLIFLFF